MSAEDDPKDAAQRRIAHSAEQCPLGVYTHRKGGEYVVFGHTIDEATLEPLVHYYSLAKQTRWTRTVANFTELVDGRPRFERTRDHTSLELHVARSALT